MLRVQKSVDQALVIFALSGRIEEQNVSELQRLVDAETEVAKLIFDLEELRLVDRAGVKFLAACDAKGIKLTNCPSYIQQWIHTGAGTEYEP